MKEKISNEKLCQGCPDQFVTYFNYVMNLNFDEDPDYSMLKKLIRNTASDANLDIFDDVFDWSLFLSSYSPQNPLSYLLPPRNNLGQSLEDSYKEIYKRAQAFRFDDFEGVKIVIKNAYNVSIEGQIC